MLGLVVGRIGLVEHIDLAEHIGLVGRIDLAEFAALAGPFDLAVAAHSDPVVAVVPSFDLAAAAGPSFATKTVSSHCKASHAK